MDQDGSGCSSSSVVAKGHWRPVNFAWDLVDEPSEDASWLYLAEADLADNTTRLHRAGGENSLIVRVKAAMLALGLRLPQKFRSLVAIMAQRPSSGSSR